MTFRGVWGEHPEQGGQPAPLSNLALFTAQEAAQDAAGELRRTYGRYCVVYPVRVEAGGVSALFWALVTSPGED